jgi:hypothetical protein
MDDTQGPLDSVDFALIGHIVMYSVVIVGCLLAILMIRSVTQGAHRRSQHRRAREDRQSEHDRR